MHHVSAGHEPVVLQKRRKAHHILAQVEAVGRSAESDRPASGSQILPADRCVCKRSRYPVEGADATFADGAIAEIELVILLRLIIEAGSPVGLKVANHSGIR
jgi:hypothetical protein